MSDLRLSYIIILIILSYCKKIHCIHKILSYVVFPLNCTKIFWLLTISSFLSCHEKATEALCIRTNPDLPWICPCFRVLRLIFVCDFFHLLLVRFHQAKIMLMKHLIQKRNNEARVGVEPSTLRSWPSFKRRSEPLGHAADRLFCGTVKYLSLQWGPLN